MGLMMGELMHDDSVKEEQGAPIRIEKKNGQKGMPMMGAAMFKNLLINSGVSVAL